MVDENLFKTYRQVLLPAGFSYVSGQADVGVCSSSVSGLRMVS